MLFANKYFTFTRKTEFHLNYYPDTKSKLGIFLNFSFFLAWCSSALTEYFRLIIMIVGSFNLMLLNDQFVLALKCSSLFIDRMRCPNTSFIYLIFFFEGKEV